jgi:hypothetical protein
VSLLEVVAAILLLVGSYLVLRTVFEAETWDADAPQAAPKPEEEAGYRRAA